MRWHFVDRITEMRPWEMARGVKTVSFEEYSLKKPWHEKGSLPESLLLESILQLGAWLAIYSSDFKVQPFIAKIDRIDFLRQARMGEVLRTEVHILSRNEEGLSMSGTVRCADELIASGENAVGIFRPAEGYYDPERLRSLFGQIYRA